MAYDQAENFRNFASEEENVCAGEDTARYILVLVAPRFVRLTGFYDTQSVAAVWVARFTLTQGMCRTHGTGFVCNRAAIFLPPREGDFTQNCDVAPDPLASRNAAPSLPV